MGLGLLAELGAPAESAEKTVEIGAVVSPWYVDGNSFAVLALSAQASYAVAPDAPMASGLRVCGSGNHNSDASQVNNPQRAEPKPALAGPGCVWILWTQRGEQFSVRARVSTALTSGRSSGALLVEDAIAVRALGWGGAHTFAVQPNGSFRDWFWRRGRNQRYLAHRIDVPALWSLGDNGW